MSDRRKSPESDYVLCDFEKRGEVRLITEDIIAADENNYINHETKKPILRMDYPSPAANRCVPPIKPYTADCNEPIYDDIHHIGDWKLIGENDEGRPPKKLSESVDKFCQIHKNKILATFCGIASVGLIFSLIVGITRIIANSHPEKSLQSIMYRSEQTYWLGNVQLFDSLKPLENYSLSAVNQSILTKKGILLMDDGQLNVTRLTLFGSSFTRSFYQVTYCFVLVVYYLIA